MSKKEKNTQDLDATPLQDEQLNPNPVDSEGLAIIREKRKFRTVITGADFKEFAEGEQYEGTFIEPVVRKKDGLNVKENPNEKAGTVMGYLFKDDSGHDVIIGASQQVTEVIDLSTPGKTYIRFTFLGKGVNAKNQPFNRFRIEVSE